MRTAKSSSVSRWPTAKLILLGAALTFSAFVIAIQSYIFTGHRISVADNEEIRIRLGIQSRV